MEKSSLEHSRWKLMYSCIKAKDRYCLVFIKPQSSLWHCHLTHFSSQLADHLTPLSFLAKSFKIKEPLGAFVGDAANKRTQPTSIHIFCLQLVKKMEEQSSCATCPPTALTDSPPLPPKPTPWKLQRVQASSKCFIFWEWVRCADARNKVS